MQGVLFGMDFEKDDIKKKIIDCIVYGIIDMIVLLLEKNLVTK